MITLTATILSDVTNELTIEKEAKTFAGAWNKIREIREEFDAEHLDGTIITISLGDLTPNEKILPTEILLKKNKNGKIEFKDMKKIRARLAKEFEKEGGLPED